MKSIKRLRLTHVPTGEVFLDAPVRSEEGLTALCVALAGSQSIKVEWWEVKDTFNGIYQETVINYNMAEVANMAEILNQNEVTT